MPAYNEQDCIEAVLRAWTDEFERLFGAKYRIVVVNDGSRDRTGEILDAIAEGHKRVIVLHQANAGHGAALLNSYHYATGLDTEYVFHVDSDDQFRPSDFATLWELR